uniref:Uncharacterized protein n=1 Tax=Rhizophora mucronata TaxID=61149 RepID=A0A2P2P0G2_RHIMU
MLHFEPKLTLLASLALVARNSPNSHPDLHLRPLESPKTAAVGEEEEEVVVTVQPAQMG